MQIRRAIILMTLLAVATMFAGCCSCPCSWNASRWWDPCCSESDCAPIGDPCDCCDPAG